MNISLPTGWLRRLSHTGRYGEAEENFKKSVELNPANWAGPFELGNVYLKTHRFAEAIEAYKKALDMNANSDWARLDLGMAYLGIGNKDAAREQYNILKEQNSVLAKDLLKLIESY